MMGAITNNDVKGTRSPRFGDDGKPVRDFKSQEELGTSILFNKETHLDTIIQYIKGMKWSVSYFLQIRNINDQLTPLDVNLSPTLQKYNRINDLIVTLQTTIEQSDVNNITGEMIINSGFLPNVHDMFLAELTGGRQALFVLTSVVAKSYNLHPAYYAEFKLFSFLDDNSDYYNNLVLKTVKEYTYDADHLYDYSAPIILSSDYKKKLSLKEAVPTLLDYYLKNFLDTSMHVIVPPTTGDTLYLDTLLTSFLFKIVNISDHELMTNITRIDIDLPEIRYSIWDMLINRDLSMLNRLTSDIGFMYTPYSVSSPVTRHIRYLGINFVANKIGEETESKPDYKDIAINKTTGYADPINIDLPGYVVSQAFYNNDLQGCGIFELAIFKYLRGEILDMNTIDIFLSQYDQWSTKDQFYLIPILIVLIKDCMQNTYSSI